MTNNNFPISESSAPLADKQQDSNTEQCIWLTIDQVERKLHITRSTVYRWRRIGVLRAYRLNGTRNAYFLDSELNTFLRQNPITPSGRLDKEGLLYEP